ncbi:MAG: hypothetical protein HKM04_07130 [Legionellales bacterium]|nr:hypothetical protein [Legionellales bacterium]
MIKLIKKFIKYKKESETKRKAQFAKESLEQQTLFDEKTRIAQEKENARKEMQAALKATYAHKAETGEFSQELYNSYKKAFSKYQAI